MRQNLTNSSWQIRSPFLIRTIRQNIPIVLFLLLSVTAMTAVYRFFSVESRFEGQALSGGTSLAEPNGLTAPLLKPVERLPVTQRLEQSPGPLRIGIIAGHLNSDSGAVCSDGLTEVQITASLARKVRDALAESGIPGDILEEFDPRLANYSATALVSIHVDSCDYINELATGFKISGSPFTDSSKLSICLQQAYAEATGLPYHPNSVTPHMSNYHAFREIAPGTPATIIEVGFLFLDRETLTTEAHRTVEGLTEGILCFLDRAK